MLKMNSGKLNSNPSALSMEQFLTIFFKGNLCNVSSDNNLLTVQLTKKMDLALMNRPFYWQYIEAMGNVGQPMELHFKLDPTMDKGEWIHFGSPRFQQICTLLKKTSKFTQLYEIVNVNKNTMLQPWLLTNFCITYEGKQIKEELLSIGLNLINGTIIFDMMELLRKTNLQQVISNQCYTISPLIKLSSAYARIEKIIQKHILNQDHQWAIESLQLLKEELDMIEHFFQDTDHKEELDKEKTDTLSRLQPKIKYSVWNGGLLYLTEDFIQNVEVS